MQTAQHRKHITSRTSHQRCNECAADNSRNFVTFQTWHYDHVADYLQWAMRGLAGKGVRTSWAGSTLNASQFAREFSKALHTRIYLKVPPCPGRKLTDGYQQRLNGMRFRGSNADATYLRNMAERSAYGDSH